MENYVAEWESMACYKGNLCKVSQQDLISASWQLAQKGDDSIAVPILGRKPSPAEPGVDIQGVIAQENKRGFLGHDEVDINSILSDHL